MSCGCMKNTGNEMGKHHMHSHGSEGTPLVDDTKTALGILNERYAKTSFSDGNVLPALIYGSPHSFADGKRELLSFNNFI